MVFDLAAFIIFFFIGSGLLCLGAMLGQVKWNRETNTLVTMVFVIALFFFVAFLLLAVNENKQEYCMSFGFKSPEQKAANDATISAQQQTIFDLQQQVKQQKAETKKANDALELLWSQKTDCNATCYCEPTILPQLQQIAWSNSVEQSYLFNAYDCEQYSQELVRRLQNVGYAAEYCTGNADLGQGQVLHAWVRVPSIYIEATTGQVIEPVVYAKNYFGKCGA